MGVGDGLDDLDGTPEEAEEHRQRYQAQLRVFKAKRTNRQGSEVETASGGVSDALSGGGEGDSSLCSDNGVIRRAVRERARRGRGDRHRGVSGGNRGLHGVANMCRDRSRGASGGASTCWNRGGFCDWGHRACRRGDRC